VTSATAKRLKCALLTLRVLYGLATIVSLSATIWLGLKWHKLLGENAGTQAQIDHAPALFGIPVSITAALALVCCARALDPHASVSFLGLRLKGASVTAIFWLVAFAALTIAIRALW